MTAHEAQAADVLLDWVFSKGQHDPTKLKHACILLARGAEKHGGKWTPARVVRERW